MYQQTGHKLNLPVTWFLQVTCLVSDCQDEGSMLLQNETTQSVTSLLRSEAELRLSTDNGTQVSTEFQEDHKINSTVILGNVMQFLLPTNI